MDQLILQTMIKYKSKRKMSIYVSALLENYSWLIRKKKAMKILLFKCNACVKIHKKIAKLNYIR